MSIVAGAARAYRAIAVLCLTAAVGVLSGCGGEGSTGPETVVTVTVTPTVTAKAAKPTATGPSTPTGTAKSDVVGRKFDLGTIVAVEKESGVPVLVLDRWTVRGVPDSTLAERGVPIRVHSDAPFENQNTKVTYRIPVAHGAVFTYRHCVALDQPPVRKASTLNDFAHLQGSEKVVLVSLSSRGQAVEVQNDPAC